MPIRVARQYTFQEKEVDEFDHWTGEEVNQTADVSKLEKAAAYFRHNGIQPTAAVVEARIRELSKQQEAPPASDIAEARASIRSLQEEARPRSSNQGSQPSRPPDMQSELLPPVRGAYDLKSARKNSSKASSGSAGAMRQSMDLLDQKDQQLLGPEGLRIPSQGTEPKPAGNAGMAQAAAAAAAALGLAPEQQQQQPKGKSLIQEVKLTKAQRTQQLLEQNKHLPEMAKRALAERKRHSGNDYFKIGAYADAVEEYSLAIGLCPDAVACYTNRAAAYLKLQQWDCAVADCTMALANLEGTGLEDEMTLRGKALLRRAEAHAALGSHTRALQDYEEVLLHFPEEAKAQQGAEGARKALGVKPVPPGMRRMAVVEEDSSSSGGEEEEQQQQQQPAPSPVGQQEEQQQRQAGEEVHQVQAAANAGDPAAAATGTAAADLTADPAPARDASAAIAADPVAACVASDAATAGTPPPEPVTVAAQESAATDPTAAAHSDSASSPQQESSEQAAAAAAAVAALAAAITAGAAEPSTAELLAQLPSQDPEVLVSQIRQQLAAAYGSSHHQAAVDNTAGADVADGASDCDERDSSSDSSSSSSPDFEIDEDLHLDEEEEEGITVLPDPLAAAVVEVPPAFEEKLEQLKQAGNEKYKEGAYSQAVALYSRAIAFAPDAAVLYINRAMAQLTLNRFDKALEDASMAVALQPTSHKAYHKRHKAKLGLKDYMGAKVDLELCMQHAPMPIQQQLQAEMDELQLLADEATVAAFEQAGAAQQASSRAYGSCVIEEVVDDPLEVQQRLHDELRAKEQCSTKLAARQAETAAQLRARYELERSRKLQLEQERLRLLRAVEEQKQQGREAFRERQEKLAARRAGKEARRRANTAAAAAAAAEAGSSSTSGAGTSSSAAMDVLQHGSGRAAATAGLGAAAADPVTPPASPFDSKLIHNMAASRAARAAAAAKAAASGTCCSTPAASPMTAATPAVTPAGSYTPGSLLLQQKRHAAPTPAQVHDQVAAEVEALKEKGNALMRQGQLEEAEAAYREALQLDGDNVKVLLNLALLRVQQGDGSAAVRCCDEVLAQQGLPQQARLKALVRRGLGLELQGEFAAALQQLGQAASEERAAGKTVEGQLERDIQRLADKVEQQQQSRRQQQDLQSAAGRDVDATTPGAAVGSDRGSGSSGSQEQQEPAVCQSSAVPAFTGMRASIPVVIASDSESDSEEARQEDEQEGSCNTGSDESSSGQPVAGAAAVAAAGCASQEAAGSVSHHHQQQQQQQPEAAEVSDNTARRAKIAVVIESSEEEEEEEVEQEPAVAQQQGLQQETAGQGAPTPATAADDPFQAAEGSAAVQEPPSEAQNETAFENVQQQAPANEPAAEHVQQQEHRSLHQRSRSAGEAGDDEIDLGATAAVLSMHQLLQQSTYSAKQPLERADSGASSSSSDSSSISSSSGDDADRSSGSSGNELLWEPSAPEPVDHHQQQQDAEQLWKQQQLERQRRQQELEQRARETEWQQARLAELTAAEAETLAAALRAASTASSSSSSSSSSGSSKGGEKFTQALYDLSNRAAAAREAGNAACLKGSAQVALKHFNAAAAVSPMDAATYAGRALVWLKLKRWQHVEDDCNTALLLASKRGAGGGVLRGFTGGGGLDAAMVEKVKYRRALALKELGKTKEALLEVKQLLVGSPSDASLQQLMQELKQAFEQQLRQALQQDKQQPPQEPEQQAEENVKGRQPGDTGQAASEQQHSSTGKAANAAQEEEGDEPVSQVLRHRIVIEETDGSESDDSDEAGDEPGREQLPPQLQQPHHLQQQQQSSVPAPAAAGVPAAAAAAAASKQPAAGLAPSAAAPSFGAAVMAPSAVDRAVQQLSQKRLTAPRTATEFLSTAKTLAAVKPPAGSSSKQALGDYVRLLHPSKYRAVFKRDLNQPIVGFLVTGLQAEVQREPGFVAAALLELSRVERFSLVLPMACASKDTTAALQGLLRQLEAAGQDVAPLRAAYRPALK